MDELSNGNKSVKNEELNVGLLKKCTDETWNEKL